MAKGDIAVPDQEIELAILGEGDYSVPVEDAEQTAKEIAYRILAAEDESALFDQEAVTSPRDILGEPFFVKSVRWNKSQYAEAGPNVFALITATRPDDASEFMISCGSRNVMAQLFRLAQLGKLPLDYPLRFEENQTAAGFGALWLKRA